MFRRVCRRTGSSALYGIMMVAGIKNRRPALFEHVDPSHVVSSNVQPQGSKLGKWGGQRTSDHRCDGPASYTAAGGYRTNVNSSLDFGASPRLRPSL